MNAVHNYTKAGTYTVRLTAFGFANPGEVNQPTDAATVSIRVLPGPLARISIEPSSAQVEAGKTTQFSVKAFDQFGNAITSVRVAWSTTNSAGSVGASGLFQASTHAGAYPGALSVSVSDGRVAKAASADVTIRPGPLASLSISGAPTTIFTGDSAQLRAEGTDRYGNAVTLNSAKWSTSASLGSIEGSGNATVFTANRQPGSVTVAVSGSDGTHSAAASDVLQIKSGYCDENHQSTLWTATWWVRNPDGTRGAQVGTSVFPATFDQNWNTGPIIAGRSDNVEMSAIANIVVQRDGPVAFKIGGDDGYRLWVDGAQVLGDWTTRGYETKSTLVILSPGVHHLRIDYYQQAGFARLSFQTDPGALRWNVARTCHGKYVAFPTDSSELIVSSASQSSVESRFDLTGREVTQTSFDNQSAFLLSDRSMEHRYVVFLDGLNSSANCNDVASTVPPGGGLWARMTNMTHFAQSAENSRRATSTGSSPDLVDFRNHVPFSWSGEYENCETGAIYYGPNIPVGQPLYPIYNDADTCSGVVPAEEKLAGLLNHIATVDLNATFDLVGHSMGGMTVAYYLATAPRTWVQARIHSITTLDAPLNGVSLDVIQKAFVSGSCAENSQAMSDILGQSDVVPTIGTLANTALASRVRTVTISVAGSHLPGDADEVSLPCSSDTFAGGLLGGATYGAAIGGPIGALIGAAIGAYLGNGVDQLACHTGVWSASKAMALAAEGVDSPPLSHLPVAGLQPNPTTTQSPTPGGTIVSPTAAVPSTAPAVGGNVTVQILSAGMMNPSALTITAGTTVTWVNTDFQGHSTVSAPGDPEQWNSGVLARTLGSNTDPTYSHTFETPGTYVYGSKALGDNTTAVITVVASQTPVANGDPAVGEQLAQSNGCTGCHSTDGSKIVGPSWKGLYGSTVTLSNGSAVTVSGAYLRESIIDPDAQVPRGFSKGVMPTNFGQKLSDAQIRDLIAYIKTLG